MESDNKAEKVSSFPVSNASMTSSNNNNNTKMNTASKSSQTSSATKAFQSTASNTNNKSSAKMEIKDKFDIVKSSIIEPKLSVKKIENETQKNVNKQCGNSSSSVSISFCGSGNNNNQKKDSANGNNHVNKLNVANNSNHHNNSKPIPIAPKAQPNELKKDNTMPSPAVLLAPRVHKIKNSGLLPTIINTNDPDDRKKRCADRYDSSESSDR